MGITTYSTLTVVSEADGEGMQAVAAFATKIGLQHTGVIILPINGNYYLNVFPSGSKAFWTDEDEHLNNLQQVVDFIRIHNKHMGGRYIVSTMLTLRENPENGTYRATTT